MSAPAIFLGTVVGCLLDPVLWAIGISLGLLLGLRLGPALIAGGLAALGYRLLMIKFVLPAYLPPSEPLEFGAVSWLGVVSAESIIILLVSGIKKWRKKKAAERSE